MVYTKGRTFSSHPSRVSSSIFSDPFQQQLYAQIEDIVILAYASEDLNFCSSHPEVMLIALIVDELDVAHVSLRLEIL